MIYPEFCKIYQNLSILAIYPLTTARHPQVPALRFILLDPRIHGLISSYCAEIKKWPRNFGVITKSHKKFDLTNFLILAQFQQNARKNPERA